MMEREVGLEEVMDAKGISPGNIYGFTFCAYLVMVYTK